jgi:energy-coupling factor transporter ATP-binding protein EcfA2
MRPNLIFVMGPTCSGKSTLLQIASQMSPSVGLVEVGKMLRAKYPPSHFAGQCNPAHTAGEAWDLCRSEVDRLTEGRKGIILVDGQPRDRHHVEKIYEHFVRKGKYKVRFILVDAELAERERRARASRSGEDLETLAIPRLTNDMISNYTVMVEIIKQGGSIEVFDSTNMKHMSPSDMFAPLIRDIIFNAKG